MRSKIVHGSELKARDLTFELTPDGYPDTIEERLNILVYYVAELVRASLVRELLNAAPGSQILVDWNDKLFS